MCYGGPVKFDRKTHTITRGKQKIVLPYKTWRVAVYLFEAAPQIVSRATLINQIWDGNSYVGEKALNQALWTIRTSLGDDARTPIYIRTIPRRGYQWIGDNTRANIKTPKRFAALATLAVSVFVGLTADIDIRAVTRLDSPDLVNVSSANGYRAISSPGKILVNYPEGCLLTILAGADKNFSTAAFSENGNELAFRVNHAGQCKLIVVDLKSKRYRKFDACPSTVSPVI